jgi:oligoribonuclease NrnB/cAMP/cGMP phosphodiesterase (DHH superfamily)
VVVRVEAIITHGDADGVAAAGLYLYLRDNPEAAVYFTEPYNLHYTVNRASRSEYKRVVIADLGVNPSILSELLEQLRALREKGVDVVWYDHHVWNENWVRSVSELGVKLHVDTSTCATGVVAKYTPPLRSHVDYVFIEQLTRGVCAGDLWRFDHWLGPYYIRLVRRRDKDSWRRKVLVRIASGEYWSREFNSRVEEHIDRELSLLSSSLAVFTKSVGKSYKIAVVRGDNTVDSSFIAPYIMGRYGVNVVVVASSDGKLSFRSREVAIRDLAIRLGGGGHPYAAGSKIRIPWFIRLLSRLRGNLLLVYVANLVSRELERLGAYSGQ